MFQEKVVNIAQIGVTIGAIIIDFDNEWGIDPGKVVGITLGIGDVGRVLGKAALERVASSGKPLTLAQINDPVTARVDYEQDDEGVVINFEQGVRRKDREKVGRVYNKQAVLVAAARQVMRRVPAHIGLGRVSAKEWTRMVEHPEVVRLSTAAHGRRPTQIWSERVTRLGVD